MRKLACLALLAGCGAPPAPTATFTAPQRLSRALSVVSDVQAEAELVPRGGVAQPRVALVRGDDGVSFSGFLPAEPGEYTLNLIFTGVPAAGGARLFLGRWRSDAFTVIEGDAATPRFTDALDVIGAEGDGGDPDQDGLGNLDELLLGADPNRPDSDGDGAVDGRDCAPATAEATPYLIREGGSALDCDGDGARRPDVPWGSPGMDCDDRAPEVSPTATDDCGTARDEDCNPATCPVDDTNPPTLGTPSPGPDAVLGCHAQVSLPITDEGRVTLATMTLLGASAGADVVTYMTQVDGVWVSPVLNQYAGLDGYTAGPVTVRFEATDGAGNTARSEVQYSLRLEVPEVTSMTPLAVGATSAPVQITVQAQAPAGLARVDLYAAKKGVQGLYDPRHATLVGTSAASPASFTVTPASMEDGEYLLYPVVVDAVGNALEPNTAPVPVPGVNGDLEVGSDYLCVPMASAPRLPVRSLVVGSSGGYTPATMQDLLPAALAAAAQVDPAAALVQIVGFGVGADGRVRLDDATSYTKRWLFGFYNPTADRAVAVTWLTPAYPGPNPNVDPNAGNITAEEPLSSPASLADTPDVLAARASQGSCAGPLTGVDDDTVIYLQQDGAAVVQVLTADQYWRGTAQPPVTELTDCQ
ncbi:MAG: putative metal-binding motif-containing protein [Myxococcales bacterium]|nr:putative metal-binding motif-containing protein [Myxococcales bacterium]MCB9650196.1 putative metal-binding motif-containing protein [Deltaproteobacteria bacterium]